MPAKCFKLEGSKTKISKQEMKRFSSPECLDLIPDYIGEGRKAKQSAVRDEIVNRISTKCCLQGELDFKIKNKKKSGVTPNVSRFFFSRWVLRR